MNRRLILVIVLVAAAGAALFFFLRGDDDQKAPPAVTEAKPERDVPSTPRDQVLDRRKPTRATPSEGKDIYTLEDGTVVRDHRTNAGGYVRPSLPHKGSSPVNAAVTGSVMRAVRPIVLECMKSLPDSAYGEKPFIETRAVVSIDETGTLSVLELGPAPHDIDEAAAGEALDCIRNAAANINTHVDHEPVAEATVALRIRPFDRR